jgi:uncharacterized protein (DUF58 family)
MCDWYADEFSEGLAMKRIKIALAKAGRACVSAAQYDFCPNVNRYVYWLKQPIGWFVVAIAASMLIGAFFNSRGWIMAGGLLSVVVVGLIFPWLAIKTSSFTLRSQSDQVSEGEASRLILSVQNRLPISIWGLLVEGYFDELSASTGLASVPPLSKADYHLPIEPNVRGRYPNQAVYMTCAFPFGIWTARKQLTITCKLAVQPMTLPVSIDMEVFGRRIGGLGTGRKIGGNAEYLGVRPFRRGDLLRSVHWIQTARTGNLVVCERSQSTEQTVALKLGVARSDGGIEQSRNNLNWRVRIAATLIRLLNEQRIRFELQTIGSAGEAAKNHSIARSYKQAVEQLIDVPLDGPIVPDSISRADEAKNNCNCCFEIAPIDSGSQLSSSDRIHVHFSFGSAVDDEMTCNALIDLNQDIAQQLEAFLSEVFDETVTA